MGSYAHPDMNNPGCHRVAVPAGSWAIVPVTVPQPLLHPSPNSSHQQRNNIQDQPFMTPIWTTAAVLRANQEAPSVILSSSQLKSLSPIRRICRLPPDCNSATRCPLHDFNSSPLPISSPPIPAPSGLSTTQVTNHLAIRSARQLPPQALVTSSPPISKLSDSHQSRRHYLSTNQHSPPVHQ